MAVSTSMKLNIILGLLFVLVILLIVLLFRKSSEGYDDDYKPTPGSEGTSCSDVQYFGDAEQEEDPYCETQGDVMVGKKCCHDATTRANFDQIISGMGTTNRKQYDKEQADRVAKELATEEFRNERDEFRNG
jgi:hypothetical protein